jgi:threonine dehydrogenase-like Zn-dependent dehydrogenase
VKALTFVASREVAITTVPDPEIQAPTDVLVRVRLAGVCGSDLHVYQGREVGLDAGAVMGHELVGEVVEVGREVRSLRRGDLVSSPFSTSCGDCFYCARGLTARCERGQLFGWVSNGRGLQGVQAELARVPLADSTLLAIPPDVGLEEALLLGDVLSTGYFCADMAGIRPEDLQVVVGCGPVGLMAIVAARELGAERVHAIDSVPERLALARRFGATPLSLADDPVSIVREATDGRGADAVLEAVGGSEALGLAMRLVRPGGTIASVGVHAGHASGLSPEAAYDKNLTVRFGRCPVRRYMERLLPLVREKRHPLAAIVSHRLSLDDGVDAYRMFDEKLDGCTKAVLRP